MEHVCSHALIIRTYMQNTVPLVLASGALPSAGHAQKALAEQPSRMPARLLA